MVSHMADVARRGIWASLTGGWFYDTNLDLLSNIVHMYIWAFLVITPFILYLLFPSSLITSAAYCAVIGMLFLIVKFGNHSLHRFFDTHESEEPKAQENSQDNGSRRDSLDSFREPLGGLSTSDPTVPTSWRQIHPRRRVNTASSQNAEEAVPLRTLNISSSANEDDNNGRSSSRRESGEFSRLFNSADSTKVEDEETTMPDNVKQAGNIGKEIKGSRADSPSELPDRLETINFQADVHVHDREPNDAETSFRLVSEVDEVSQNYRSVSQRDVMNVEATVHSKALRLRDVAESEGYDEFLVQLRDLGSTSRIRPSRGSCHLSTGNIREERLSGRVRRTRRARRHRLDITGADSSVTSVVNQPTTSMETILSTFRPAPRTSLPAGDTASQPKISRQSEDSSPQRLHRTRSEFYTHNTVQKPRMGSEVCLEFGEVSPVNAAANTAAEMSAAKSEDKTHSEPRLASTSDSVFVSKVPSMKLQTAASGSAETIKHPLQQSLESVHEDKPDDAAENVDVDLTDYVSGSLLNVNSEMQELSSNINGFTEDDHLPEFPEEIDVLNPEASILIGRVNRRQTACGMLTEEVLPLGRPICGSSLLRRERSIQREREQSYRALVRPDSPHPRREPGYSPLPRREPEYSRREAEVPVGNRGIVHTLTSWLSGTPQTERVTVAGEVTSTDQFPPAFDLYASSATRTFLMDENTSTGLNRYSPQESVVSGENRPEFSFPLRHRGVPGSESSDRYNRSSRFTLLTNPLWNEEDTDAENQGSSERETRRSSSVAQRQATWTLLPDGSERILTDTEGTARLLQICREVNKASQSEYRLGPKSWKELFENVDQYRTRQRRPLYKMSLFGGSKEIKLRLDRLTLMALFDRSRTVFECVLAVVLAVCVGAAGCVLLSRNYVSDLSAFFLCFIFAGCQYSLLKSVQPDSTSPTHGYNRIVVYSRAIYFCALAGLVVLMDHIAEGMSKNNGGVTLFGFNLFTAGNFVLTRDCLIGATLCLPLVFTYGLLPQIDTFLTYLLEQVDIHLFGGTGTFSLLSAAYTLTRNLLGVLVLHGILYAALDDFHQNGATPLNLSFSLYLALMVALAYHLSRLSTDPVVLWNLVRKVIKRGDCQPWPAKEDTEIQEEKLDMVQTRAETTMYNRLRSDMIVCPLFIVLFFVLHGSTLFTVSPEMKNGLLTVAVVAGFVLSYVVPRIRAQMPWMCISTPLIQSYRPNRSYRAETVAPRLTVFEKFYVWLRVIKRNILFPCIFLAVATSDAVLISAKFGPHVAAVIITITGLKFLKLGFRDGENQYLILAFTYLVFNYDVAGRSEHFLLNYWLVSMLYYKCQEWLHKWKFVLTYVAPWQITWGSAFHAFAQPFSIPHAGMLLLQTCISTVISSPLNPFLGSAIFLTAYPRPVKFWEKTYKTKRLDNSNTRLAVQLEGNSGNDDNNLNSIFYEHLTHSLQKSLCGDIAVGKWGNVSDGDFFILASDYLNCLVHIIEIGNGLVTFQVRGLEFRGTYCQQREVEAITENVDENRGFCCCEPGHLPRMLSLNSAFNQRWLAWQVYSVRYVVQGYSVSDNNASTMFQIYDLRKILITFYIKTMIYYLTRSPKLLTWLSFVEDQLAGMHLYGYCDLDPLFMLNIDVDYDYRYHGISRHNLYEAMREWIEYCASVSDYPEMDVSEMSPFVTLAFAVSVLGRRVLGAAAQVSLHSVDWFLHGLHALFKGDYKIECSRDQWVFSDMDIVQKIVSPAIRMALKLHQDHFTSSDEYEQSEALYSAIVDHEANIIICHEGDPKWRQAVLDNTPSLLALRHVVDDNRDDYKIIMLNIRNLDFRLIKINKECVRGFWAGQLQELVYFRNRNPERGSIQNAKQALRNMINSSCDQPIGYPIYVSPLTTSYADTHTNLCKVVGGPLTWDAIRDTVRETWEEVRNRCYESCSGSGGSEPRIRPREPPIVVSYNPQQQRPVEFSRRSEA